MTGPKPQDLAGMVPLDHAECLRLLGRGVIGRVIHTAGAIAGGPTGEVPPVAGEVIFRTGVAN